MVELRLNLRNSKIHDVFFHTFCLLEDFFVFLAHKVQCVFCGLEEMAAAPVDGPGADLVIHRRPNQDYTSCDHFLTSTAWLTLQGGKKPCRIALQFLVPCFGFAIAFGTNLRRKWRYLAGNRPGRICTALCKL